MEREDLMAPKGLKIGDTFDEKDFSRTFRLKIVGFDGRGNYISECIGEVKDGKIVEKKFKPVVEEVPFVSTDDDAETVEETVEEQPVVEEPKEVKATPKKKTASKKKTATKKK